jgi:hypothetical protein
MRQALLLGLAFNLYRLRLRRTLIGCKQSQLKSFVLNTYISVHFKGTCGEFLH